AKDVDTDGVLNLRKRFAQRRAQWEWCDRVEELLILAVVFLDIGTIALVSVRVKLVEGPLVLEVKTDQKAACNTCGKPGDVDNRVELIAPESAKGDGQVVSNHGSAYW